MDTLGCIQAWLIWQEQQEQSEVPEIQISAIPGLLILILILTPLIDLHPVLAAEVLKRGNRGQEVVALQNELKQAGCMSRSVRSTGYYGKITKAAVEKLQQTHGLRVDGVVGKQTRNALNYKSCFLKVGSRGEKVRQLQVQLNNWGFPVTKVDGVFGKETRAAVIRFQESKGLKSDGIVGPKTAKVLQTPQTQVSQSTVSSQVDEVGRTETIQSPLAQFSIKSLEQGYYIPTFQKVNNLKSNLQSGDKQKQYRAALELVQIWTKQETVKSIVQEYSNINNLYDPINPTIIVSVVNQKNNSKPEKLIQEKLPIDLLTKIFDNAMEEDEKPRQQFIAALFRTYLIPTPTDKLIEVLKNNLDNKYIDSNYNKIDSELVMSITDEAVEALSIISDYYPQKLSDYWKKNYKINTNSYYEIIPYYDDNFGTIKLRDSTISMLNNLAENGEEEALDRLKIIIKNNPKLAYDMALVLSRNGNTGDQELHTQVIDVLKNALSDSEKSLEAALTLAKIQLEKDQELQTQVRDVLKKALSDSETTFRVASKLAEIQLEKDQELQTQVRDVLKTALSNPEKSLEAAYTLAKLGFKDDKELENQVIESLSNNLKKAEPLQANGAGLIFGQSPSELCTLVSIGKSAIPFLNEVSQTSLNPKMKEQIALMISYIENPSVNYPFYVKVCTSPGGGSATGTAEETASCLADVKKCIKKP